jgi:hypothetical protein
MNPMKQPRKPRRIPKAVLRQRVAHDRSNSRTRERENHLRSLMRRVFSDGTSIRGEP